MLKNSAPIALYNNITSSTMPYKLFLSTLLLPIFLTAQTNHLTADQLVGTWRASTTYGQGMFATKTEFMFTLYADGRIYSVQNGIPYNGAWRVEEDLFLYQYSTEPGISKTQTTFFNGQNWYYTSLRDNARYIAVRVSTQPSVIPVVFLGVNKTPARPQGTILDLAKMSGHWKTTNNKGETFHFNVYPDQRFYVVDGENALNASFTFQNDRLYEYFDFNDEPAIFKTISFDGKTWKYTSIETGTQYTATKMSATPQKMTPAAPKPKPADKNKIKPNNDPGRYSPNSGICLCCAGTHKDNCSSCGGQGGHYDRVSYQQYNATTGYYDTYYRDEWRTCTALGCDNGKTDCDCCKKRSDGFNPYSMDKVPHDETMIGDWNGNGGDVWTFYDAGSYDYKIFQIISGGQKITGKWAIEDGLMKLQYTYKNTWDQYSFSNWSTTQMILTNRADYSIVQLTKR